MDFEAAVDAIVDGDLATLQRLLSDAPTLTQVRSPREHRSTLLHYVSANGVEDDRQRAPSNILEITELLLNTGADVNAESNAYGGHSTALLLTATSCHPEQAGLQLPLLQLLLDHGAHIDGTDGSSTVNACLRNGRRQAAEFLAARGAALDLEGAAGVGRLDLVENCFAADGTLKAPSTQTQLEQGFVWACEFGRKQIVEFFLENGVSANTMIVKDAQSGLHWAAYGGHHEIVKLLLERGAATDVKDGRWDGTPLEWARYRVGQLAEDGSRRDAYAQIDALLTRSQDSPLLVP